MIQSVARLVQGPVAAFTPASDDPIRAELLSVERLEQQAEAVAAGHRVSQGFERGRPVRPRLRDNAKVLTEAYQDIANSAKADQPITPSAEWMLDNFFIVEEQVREILDDMPVGFYRRLPKLIDGPLAGYPRVFGIAWDIIAHTDSGFDQDRLCRYLIAYQRVHALTIGELWAFAITLRLVLVENLRRLADAIVSRHAAYRQANLVADRIIGLDDQQAEPVDTVLKSLGDAPLSKPFAVQLSQQLRDQDQRVIPVFHWLDEQLAAQGTNADDIVREEHQTQGAMNVTVRNIITSMRLVSTIDWPEFFESVSLVDSHLRQASDFAEMDFPTRDLYRRTIEELARGSGRSELEVTRRLIAVAERSDPTPLPGDPTPRQREPGYYLIGGGARAFEDELAYKAPPTKWLARANSAMGISGYLALVGMATASLLALAVALTTQSPLSAWSVAALVVFGLIPASDLALALINQGVIDRFGPAILPGLELRDGVPGALRTMIVMPTLLTTAREIEELIKRLEVHYLSSADGEFFFALLSDWTDSATETSTTDMGLLQLAVDGIADLNRRYGPGPDAADRFYLLHRKRVWNAGQGKWIGWERKRGKLHELNRLLRGATDTTFIPTGERPVVVPDGVRYVITLDSDTRLPRGAAKRLVGKMAHPLNRPRIDPEALRAVEGHGILQPRVTPSLPAGRGGSLFQRAFSGANGLDPYAFAVSDIYQDLFQEGSYVGKGIYDVDSFETVLHGRIPESTVLSHDLLEGIFNRAALASDVELVEEFPSRYDVAAARQHRWVRGDWQLLPWVFGNGRERGAHPKKAAVPAIGRWKMFDNLRRSLSNPSALAALLVGWTLPPAAGAMWTGFILSTFALPLLLPSLLGIIPTRVGISKRSHFRGIGHDLVLGLLQAVFLVTFLAHQAWLSVDAILRTLARLHISRRYLLEWTTAAQAAYLKPTVRTVVIQLIGSVGFGIVAFAAIAASGHDSWPVAIPFLLLWMASPGLALWASQDPEAEEHFVLAARERRDLRLVARATWRFFEAFITADDSMLPPDNFQEDPQPVIAHRTSPTNIGLYLLAAVAVRDFGWNGTLDTVDRIEATLASVSRMERYRGHLYNWYDTRELRPLEPRYVSSVDSGNLAGHLIVLGNACRDMIRGPFMGDWQEGLEDALELARQARHELGGEVSQTSVSSTRLEDAFAEIAATLVGRKGDLIEASGQLAKVAEQCDAAFDAAQALVGENADSKAAAVLIWTDALRAQARSHQRDFNTLLPWAGLLAGESGLADLADAEWLEEKGGVRAAFAGHLSLQTIVARCAELDRQLSSGDATPAGSDPAAADAVSVGTALSARVALIAALRQSAESGQALVARLRSLAQLADELYAGMDFRFLFDTSRQLLSIGYQVQENRLDANYYDLLASEARLASFVGIAKEDIPARHWFRLGRTLTPVSRGSVLLSWSGSMFEFLMPSLVMREPPGSLLEHTNRIAVTCQISYGAQLGVPWGVSESQYNARDLEFTYQYSGFGVPDLGYKRGLGENIVIAPYATALAAMVYPSAAVKNFKRLAEEGGRGAYGWYEALDYTPERLPEGQKVAVIHAYMAHHQAMSILAIDNALLDGAMRNRFHAEPIVQATDLLLQERMPRGIPVARPPSRQASGAIVLHQIYPETQRRFITPFSTLPRTHLLSNGRYSLMVTGVGSGYSRWGDFDLTRWREDRTCDDWGSYVFVRDMRTGHVWSVGYQPTLIEPEKYDVVFSEDRVEITREDGAITTVTVIAISPEDDAEVRRVSITNHGSRPREIELTSYAEIALARPADDRAHPAFSKLFIETEFLPDYGALIARRRPRAAGDTPIWAAHMAVVEGNTIGEVQFETDRPRFLGRGQTARTAVAVVDGWPLSNTVGAVLDPIFSLRRRVRLARGETASIAFWTLAAPSREQLLGLIDKHHDAMAYQRATTFAWTQGQVQLHHIGIGPGEAHLYQRIANRILYSDASLRPVSDVIIRGARNASTLWANGISGDLPIVLARIEDGRDLDVIRQLLRAFEYWRMKQLAVDLVILNEKPASYVQDLQNAIETMVRTSRAGQSSATVKGKVYVLRADLISMEVRELLQSAARVVIPARRGSLTEIIRRIPDTNPNPQPAPIRAAPFTVPDTGRPQPELEFFNGFGGFANNGRDYVTILEKGQWTPAPWINVVSNPHFGFHVSVEGGSYTWAVNSQQNQITPWSNDPVRDPPGEVIYLRDEDTGEIWTPTALPIRETSSYLVTHGQGFSRFEHSGHEIGLSLNQYVPLDDPIKISRLTITNESDRSRRISVTSYTEWVLGTSRSVSAAFIITERDPETGAIYARNPWSNDFGDRVAFADLANRPTRFTADRGEFIGRNGSLDRPVALTGATSLSGAAGAGLDPCAALQTQLTLAPGGRTEIVVLLGETASKDEARALIAKYRAADLDSVMQEVTDFWDRTLNTVQVKTPDRTMDIMLNAWLPYQTLACRVWARAAFYQASGAYGFRDQLQDVAALCASRPEIARAHILRAAARQFREGDVQHWWLPESGRGIRTRISDDTVWLAYVVGQYIEVTGDSAILEEQVPFLEGPTLNEDQHDNFFEPTVSHETATLFEHCARALDKTLALGPHRLPLMGTGDWNDGMNAVGAGGKGESVWLGWFLYAALTDFAHRGYERSEAKRVAAWLLHAAVLKEALEEAWDGDWYRRAYFDDGSPMGSIEDSECRIDSIAQSWSVISRAAEPARARRAMAAVEKYLIRRDEGMILLFEPPFDVSNPSPGYIQGYPKGVRENGGQYTHAATWTVLAFAMLGDGDRAAECFSILNPINHANTRAAIHRYRVEPYVICGDVYSMPPQVGRGGWTWYSGSAGWMYRVGLESILGFQLRGDTLKIDPCIPRAWPRFEIAYQYRSSRYEIVVENPNGVSRGVASVALDGAPLGDNSGVLQLTDDGHTHTARIVLG